MSLDMLGGIDVGNRSQPPGGVELIERKPGGYTGPGNTWEEGRELRPRKLRSVVIQAASAKAAERIAEAGGAQWASDMRTVYLNDGTMLWPDADGQFSSLLRFSDGREVRDWRVVEADNRPWHNYCKAIVVLYRGNR